ncbi:MAG TPA: DUF4112 domain-containing protein [Thermoanaerobaculia bacterium]|nr:DUF4112 domain-containing protein [Thermoanaerobaculia bacterium]
MTTASSGKYLFARTRAIENGSASSETGPHQLQLAAHLSHNASVLDKVHIPDVIEPDSALPADLIALRRFAYLMDEAFRVPGTKMRVGVDAVLGLIPGIGDIIGALLSTWIIAGALRHRVRPLVIGRMVFNVVVDLFFGAIPVAGDVFDFLYEENMMNMRLLEKHRDRQRPPRTASQIALVLAAIVAFLVLTAVAFVAGVIALGLWIIGQR